MRPIPEFLSKPKYFWATVRSLSQTVGYSRQGKIIVPTISDMVIAFEELGLDTRRIFQNGQQTKFASELQNYFSERSRILINEVEPKLLNVDQARELFKKVNTDFDYKCPIPLNKQKGEKREVAFLTALVNMMVELHAKGLPCDYDPRKLTTITKDGAPLRTMARRVDGAFPKAINPIAIWEIKEYYYTTTFGSRVADGVYETLLDGMEIEELQESENINVKHYLMVDAHYTWWECGKPYLCRMFDMLHMGYVDEILFGKEIVEEMPRIVSEWVDAYEHQNK